MVYDAEVLVTGEVPNEGIRNYIVTQIPLKDFNNMSLGAIAFPSALLEFNPSTAICNKNHCNINFLNGMYM
jgi:hypothetical protein